MHCLAVNISLSQQRNILLVSDFHRDHGDATSVYPFTLKRNVTYRPGTLVKSATGPSVFVVVDSFGTMRWIPTEEKARSLW